MLVLAASLIAASEARAEETAWPQAEQRLVNLINRERSDRGLDTLRVNLQMSRIARDWSSGMAASSELSHRPDLQRQVDGPWRRLGENVGRASYTEGQSIERAIDRLHRAFMDSSGHRRNILGDYNHVGVGVRVGPSGGLWVTVVFLEGPRNRFPLFRDIAGNTHERNTERVWLTQIAAGCRFPRYCPTRDVTRAQMATFLGRALELRPVVSDRFRDVDRRSTHAGYINALADAGIASGCTEKRFCPDRPVTRAQMGTFLARALQLAPHSKPEFVDVPPTSPHFENVNAIAREGVTAGCDDTGTRYCPNDAVRRDQMSAFLARAFAARVSFWQAPATEPEAAAERPEDTSVETGNSRTYER